MASGAKEELIAKRDELKKEIDELEAEYRNDDFPTEVEERWNALNSEFDDVVESIRKREVREERVRELSGEETNREAEPVRRTRVSGVRRTPDNIYDVAAYRQVARSLDDLPELYRDGAMMSLERAVFPHPQAKREDVQEHVERLLDKHRDKGEVALRIVQTGSEQYRRAFAKKWAGVPLNSEEDRALSLTTTEGGFAVPYTLDPTIIPTSNGSVNPFRQIARIETITGNEWRGVSSAGVTAGYRAEGAEAGDDAPTVAQPTANVEAADVFIPFSIEIGQDWSSLATEMARLVQDAKDDLEADKFVTGTGHSNTQPEGLLVGGTAVIATAAATTLAAGDLYNLDDGLPPRYRPRASIVGNRKQFNRTRQLATTDGHALWLRIGDGLRNSQTGALGEALLGYPTYEASGMVSTLTTGSSIITIGDFSHFLIVDRIGMQADLIPHLFHTGANRPSGQRGLYYFWRNTSDVLAWQAFRTLKVA